MSYEIFGDVSLAPAAAPGQVLPVAVDVDSPALVRRVTLRSDFANNRIIACVLTTRGEYKVAIPLGPLCVIFDNVLLANGVQTSDQMGAPDSLRDLYDNFGFSLGGAFKSVKKATQTVAKHVAKTAVKSVTKPIKMIAHPKATLRSAIAAARDPKAAAKAALKAKGNDVARLANAAKAPIEAQRQLMGAIPGVGPQLVKVHDKADALTKKAIRSKYTGVALMATAAVVPAVGGPALAAWTIANRIDAIQQAAERAAKAAQRGDLKGFAKAAMDAGAGQIPMVRQLQAAVPTSAQGLVRGALRNLPKGASVASAARFGLANLSPNQRALLARQKIVVPSSLSRFRGVL